jgi:hypothetical protein
MAGSLNGLGGQIVGAGAGEGGTTVDASRSTLTTGGGGTGTEGRTWTAGETTAERTTGGATTAEMVGQNGIVKSKAVLPDRSSCDKGRSIGAADASVDATDAGAWGDPP